MLVIDWDSSDAQIDAVFLLEIGDVFKCTKDIVSLQLKIQERLLLDPSLATFEVLPITPGTTLFTSFGNNSLVVIAKTENPDDMSVLKTTVLFSDFQPNDQLVGTFIFNQLPAGAVPTMVKIKPVTAFDNGDNTMAATVNILDGNNISLTGGATTEGLLETISDTAGLYRRVNGSSDLIPNHSTTSNLKATLQLNSNADMVRLLINVGSNPPWPVAGTPVMDPNDPGISGTIHLVNEITPGVEYELFLESVFGDWSTSTDIASQSGDPMEVATITTYTAPSVAPTIDDLTAGSFDVWVWYYIGV